MSQAPPGQLGLEADRCPFSGSEGSALVTWIVNLHCSGEGDIAHGGIRGTLTPEKATWDEGQPDASKMCCEWIYRAGEMARWLRALTCCSSRGPGFSSCTLLSVTSKMALTPDPGDLMPSIGLGGHLNSHTLSESPIHIYA